MYILSKLYENGMEFVWFENMRIVDATIDVDFYKTNMKFDSLITKALNFNLNSCIRYAKILFMVVVGSTVILELEYMVYAQAAILGYNYS